MTKTVKLNKENQELKQRLQKLANENTELRKKLQNGVSKGNEATNNIKQKRQSLRETVTKRTCDKTSWQNVQQNILFLL